MAPWPVPTPWSSSIERRLVGHKTRRRSPRSPVDAPTLETPEPLRLGVRESDPAVSAPIVLTPRARAEPTEPNRAPTRAEPTERHSKLTTEATEAGRSRAASPPSTSLHAAPATTDRWAAANRPSASRDKRAIALPAKRRPLERRQSRQPDESSNADVASWLSAADRRLLGGFHRSQMRHRRHGFAFDGRIALGRLCRVGAAVFRSR